MAVSGEKGQVVPVHDEKISYIGLIPVVMDITFATYARMASAPFRGGKGASTYRRDVSYALLREVISGFSVAEGQKLLPGTDWVYKHVAKSKRWKAHTVDLGDGAKVHWLGHSDAKYVMLYLHGGGYIAAATTAHMKYQFALQKAIRKQGHDFSVVSLSYTLAPKKVFPGQIAQAASALRYLVEDMKRDPSTILIAGDSAGGNLTAALLLHLAHPHPKIPELKLEKPLRGAVMISPWVSFSPDQESLKRNKHSDYITIAGVERSSNTYIGPGGRHDQYSEPMRAPVSWWTDVAGIIEDIYIWGGGGEILIDSIREFAKRIQDGFIRASAPPLARENGHVLAHGISEQPEEETQESHDEHIDVKNAESQSPEKPVLRETERVKFIETPRMAHEEMIIDYLLLMRKKGESALIIEHWIDQCLKAPLRPSLPRTPAGSRSGSRKGLQAASRSASQSESPDVRKIDSPDVSPCTTPATDSPKLDVSFDKLGEPLRISQWPVEAAEA